MFFSLILELFSLGLLILYQGGFAGGANIIHASSSEPSMMRQLVNYIANIQIHILVILFVGSYFEGNTFCVINGIISKLREKLKKG